MKKLIETNTVSFSDLFGNNKTYKVPAYQRDYSWTEENWEDLWEDITTLILQKNEAHYMGAVVLKPEGGKDFTIIDGQQRFTTLSLLVLATIFHLKKLVDSGVDVESNEENAELLYDKYIGSKAIGSLQRKSKLELNKNNSSFYQHRMAQLKEPVSAFKLTESNQLIYKCYEYFKNKIDHYSKSMKGSELAASIDFVAEHLMFIQIVVEDEFNAFTLFETLNARGVELSVSDLLKNYFLSILSDDELALEEAIHQWTEIAGTIGLNNLSDFIRYYWNSINSFTRTSTLFKTIRKSIRTKEDVSNILDELEKNADIYLALQTPASDFWRTTYQDWEKIVKYLRALRLFRSKQILPLLLAGCNNLEEQNFIQLLKISSVITFRYSVIGKYNPNELEKIYSQTARGLSAGKIKNGKMIFEALQNVYKQDEVFKADFSAIEIKTRQSPQKKLIKYILAALENHYSKSRKSLEDTNATIEHILPENPDEEYWYSKFKEPEKFIYRLGNYTLLEGALNRKCGRSRYSEKLKIYKTSCFDITNSLNYEEWNPDVVVDRQKKFAKAAVSIWRLDY